MVDISQLIVHTGIQLHTLRRFSIPSRKRQHQRLKQLHPSLESMFHHSLRINKRMHRIKVEMIQQQFEFPIYPKQPAMLIWKSSRTNLERNRKCIWQRTRILAYVKALHTFISTVRKMQLQQLKLSMDSVMII